MEWLAEEVVPVQLIECEPDKAFVHRLTDLLLKFLSNLRWRTGTIAEAPNAGCGSVQAMGFVSLDVINDQLTF